ncbi:tetratricopeptide repeat protein [archaeon]|nr:MAG: tetratricopeptide repeat protein [archaeon]
MDRGRSCVVCAVAMASTGEVALKQPRTVVVKNRSAAAIQITAEQIVLEARERSQAQQPPPPRRHVADIEELQQHRLRVRKEFEDRLRMHRQNVGIWMRYAKWEEEQHEIERARSVYERALDIDYRNTTLWMRYAEMEMRSKFINRARNVWDRAVTLLPRMDTLWYKYTYMEEILGNVNAARTLFERWTTFEPPEQAWMSYINLELRAGETERARAVYERFIACHPSQTSYMRYAKWEQRNGQQALARRIYERALEELRDDERDVALFSAFARFEERCKELDRAKVIYKFALESLPESQTRALYSEYVAFEKQYGDAKGVEDVIITKRRTQYEEAVTANGHNYDAWFDYIRMEEAEGDTVCWHALHTHYRACTRARIALCSSAPPCRLAFAMCMSGRSPTCHPWLRSDTGSGTCTCGSTMPCLRS